MEPYIPPVVLRLEDHCGAALTVHKARGQDSVAAVSNGCPAEVWEFDGPGIPWLSRVQLHELHDYLSAELGLTTRTPSAPPTASRASGAAHDPNRGSRSLTNPEE